MSQNNKPNKLLDFLNVDLPDIKRSNVNLTRSNRFSASFGYIYPTLVEEILPSDRVRGNIRTILKSNPTINSIYGSARQSHQAYFVPLRFYIRELDQNFTFNPPVGNAPSTAPFPVVHWDSQDSEGLTVGPDRGFVNPGSLLEMLEMFPAFSNIRSFYRWDDDQEHTGFHSIPPINAIPLVAYYDIIRNYYFNSQELEMPFVNYEFAHYQNQSGLNDNTYAVFNLVSKGKLDQFVGAVYDGTFTVSSDADLLGSLSNIGIQLLSPNPITAVRDDEGNFYRNVHNGYAVRCFDDDYFTTALSNDYVESLDSSARVNISQQGNQYSFAVSQLQRARQMARHVSRDILGGTNYDDYIYVHFNTKLGRELNKPYFLGSASNDFFFEDIYQMAQNEDRQLGSRAGKLEASATFNDFIDFEASEYGYLIVLSSLIPRITYFAGIPKKYLKTSMADLYSPEFDAWGFQGIPQLEISAQSQMPLWEYDNDQDFLGHEYDYNILPTENSFDTTDSPTIGMSEVKKQPAWFEHMTSYDRVHGLLISDLEQSFSVLHKSYEPGVDTVEEMISTYIHPWEFNYIFEYQSSWFDNFTWQILFDLNIYRPISKQILPSY